MGAPLLAATQFVQPLKVAFLSFFATVRVRLRVGVVMDGGVPGISMTRDPGTLMPGGDGITDDYLWPSGANFEVGPKVQSFDVPLTWTNRVPVAQTGQTGPPLIKPDGGNVANDDRVTLFLNHSCGNQSARIYYTTDGEVPVPQRSKRYAGPFTLSKTDAWFQSEHVVVGAVAVCPGLRPSPVNSRWFYVIPRTPSPVITPQGMFNACHPVRVNVTGRGILRYTVSLQGLNVPVLNLTESGCECDLPFTYRGEVHDHCTEADWPGTPWCYVKGGVCGTAFFNRRFDRCKPFDPKNARLRVPAPKPLLHVGAEFDTLVSLVARETQTAAMVEAQADGNDAPLLVPGKVFTFQQRQAGHFFVPSGYTAYTAVIATMDGGTPSSVTTSNVTVSCPSHPTPKPTLTPMPTPKPTPKPTPTSTPSSTAPTPATTPMTPAPTPTPDPLDCPPCVNPSASAPMPMSYPDRGVIAASMMVRLYSGLGENGTIYYTTDGELPTIESKRYTTPFFLTEDGQACQPAAFDDAAAQDSNSWECYVTLRALVAPARRMHPDRHGGSACLCLRHSPVSTQVFHVLSA